ncbi:NAD(P)H-binding protein [Plantactinospora sp. S1510]|uniref:NAD(P)H-binding protein n=1 Tax=Plantactinospora alkalitolerans TaxID=2789879 RepID=A0ABS0H4J9_9ACTN|nr:NAD(P)H-binding protein [Plantactinospora alkalitolerans]MBF9133059.1 NAD(P)H-binding protein [Plantactinospora alkalitolerans]
MTIVVFGARGSVGRQVLSGLQAAGKPVRAASRQPSGAFGSEVETVVADLERPETLDRALTGATGAFLYAHPAGIDSFVATARRAGVGRVALLSSALVTRPGAEHSPIARRHRTVEEALGRSDLDWTFVRGGMFARNTIGLWSRSIRTEGKVRLPYPDAHSAPVHEADLAALAVTALTAEGHGGKAYTLWGPESIALREQVAAIAAALGRPIAVEVVPEQVAQAEMAQSMPDFAVTAILRTWAAAGDRPVEISSLIPQILGRPARTFADWAIDHADDFR